MRFLYLVLFFFATNSISFAQRSGLKFEHLTSEQGLPQNTIHGIVKDKYGFMWFGTWAGICRYDGYSFKTYRYKPSDNKSINNNRIHNIYKDAEQNIWILTFIEDTLCRFNYETDNFERIPAKNVPKALVQAISRDSHIKNVSYSYQNFRWIIDATSNSLVETESGSGRKSIYSYNFANPWSLNDPYVTDIYKDDHNILWVGTFSNGINKARLNAKPFEYYYHDPFNPNSIIDNNIRAICEDSSGSLWIGTREKGITVISKNGSYRHISKGTNSIRDNQIRRIFCDSRGIVWIGTKSGLDSYDVANKRFRSFREAALQNSSVFSISEDDKQNIWIASWNGIFRYIPSQDRLIHFNPAQTLKSPHVRVIIHDRKKQIWVGTEGGGISVLNFSEQNNRFSVVRHLLHEPSNVNSVNDNRINALYEDAQGFIWIGTGTGLDRYDPVKQSFLHFSISSGLSETAIAAIVEDDNGYLWISHKKGISRLNKMTLEVRDFTMQDGLQSNEFSDGAAYKRSSDNKLFLGGNNGFNVFNPGSIQPDQTLPNTVLTQLNILNRRVNIGDEVNGRTILTRPLYLTREIVLGYSDKSFAIEFAGLHYANPKANKYAYKLEGFDKDWVYTDADRRIASYSNLAPGKYLFKVISSNCDDVWNNQPAVLNIIVRPPFWASTWAYILYLVVIMLALYVYHRYSLRISRLKAKLSYELLIREKENELHQNKLQFFTNISHEIKTPLTLILAPLERLVNLFADNTRIFTELTTMKVNGDRLLKLVNQLLDFRKLETGNIILKSQRNDIIRLLKNTLMSFGPLAETKKITFDFVFPLGSLYFFYDEDKMEKVLSNLLSNALKFTIQDNTIKVRLDLKSMAEGDRVVIEITNTGNIIAEDEIEKIFMPFRQGSDNSKGGTGIGLAYSRSLVELQGGTLTAKSLPVENEDFAETTFTIDLPVSGSNSEVIDVPVRVIESPLATQPELPLVRLDAEEAPEVLSLKEERVLINGKVPVLLVIEDSLDLRNYLKNCFDAAYQILEAENGAEGFRKASEEQPDLIISDVMMPEMDGFELCRKLKTEARTAHIPVILLTARSPDEDRIVGIETGADDYITKPFNLAVLTARVKSLLLSRHQLKERYRKEISLKPTEDVPMSPDEKLLQKLLLYVEERLSDPELNIDEICSKVGVSRTHLYRKIKAMTGLSMAEVIKEIRLKRAKQLLKDKKFNINEVSFMVGFSDADYFRKCFKAEFGVTPSEYYKSRRGEEDTEV